VSPKGLADPDRYFPELVRQFGFDCKPELGVDVQLRGLGYRPEQVQYVIPSHLHFDHAGGLYLFARSTFVIGAREMGFAYHPDEGYRPYFLLEDLVPTRDFRWVETAHDLDLFGDGSVLVLYSPGHTPGSVALFVRLPNRNFILTGDTCHYRTEVDHGVADALADQAAGLQSLHRLILMRDAWDATIWIGHDPEDWADWPHAPESID
jgi:glyoxylase-like metal-dependent hydrolase (beta-lactamase superfamily II)